MTQAEELSALLLSETAHLDQILTIVASVDRRAASAAPISDSLDALASQLSPMVSSVADVLQHVHGTLRFRGNAGDYYDVRNSLMHEVLERRLGIPLSLACVSIEVGRRAGVAIRAVGLPGHVVLTDPGDSTTWYDSFAGGRALGKDDVIKIAQRFRPNKPFDEAHLRPMSHRQIVNRTLENLRISAMRSGRVSLLPAVLELRAGLPGTPMMFRVEYADALAALGRYDIAADQRELLASIDPAEANKHETLAARYRNHRN